MLLTLALLAVTGCPPPRHAAPAAPANAVTCSITSDPAGAGILIDGFDQGATPASIKLASGPHQLKLTKSGYFALDASFDVSSSSTSFNGKLVASH